MTELEKRLKAKLPGDDTGIEIRHTMCDICTPGMQCGVDAYVKDGKIIKLEGTDNFPVSNGKLCTKGASGRQYLYREDRIRTPMKRVGPRGSMDSFEPISWDEALDTIAAAFLKQRQADPDGAVFLTGYPKWYRPFLQRLAHDFGTRNYISESSTCHQAEVMSYNTVFGTQMMCMPNRARTVIAWGSNSLVNFYAMGQGMMRLHESGGTLISIDPRNTQTAQMLADLYLRPKAGTDGALAHCMARHIIHLGLHDQAFIDRYVHGFEQYRDYVEQFTPEKTEAITGVPAADILRAAELLAKDPTGVAIPSNSLTHRVNGLNTHRSVLSLMAILGRVDGPSFYLPVIETFCHSGGGFESREKEFINSVRPANCKPLVGHERFPLWADMVNEGQGMDLIHQIEDSRPYPIHTLACFGVNNRMYPESKRFLKAMEKLDFSFAADIFWTDVCLYADIVLPACTSYERGEVKCYANRFVNFTRPAIQPLYESRSDTDIICELARRMHLGDELLEAGYDACIRYIFEPSGIQDWEALKDAPLPMAAPNAKDYVPGTYLKSIPTPSGKIELYSEAVAKYADRGLDPLPVYIPEINPPEYPFTLITGSRLPNAIHSRLHNVPWARSLRPDASVDLCAADAEKLDVKTGDDIVLSTPIDAITAKANVTELAAPGELLMFHGYREANVNDLIDIDRLDPYTGFPCFKQLPCAAKKAKKEDVS